MVRPNHSAHFDTDGLQADVMRFMAIIAFCLIAILALAKNMETEQEAQLANPNNPPESHREPQLPAAAAEREAARPAIVSAPPRPSTRNTTERETTRAPIIPKLALKSTPQPAPLMHKESVPEESAEAEPVDVEPVHEESIHQETGKPLAFRFESDRTFLSLIASGDVQLYASTPSGFLAMKSNFTTGHARPPAELYEVMAESIPPRVLAAFGGRAGETVYLVALPDRTTRQLDQYLTATDATSGALSASGGTLVIHRDGHISYES